VSSARGDPAVEGRADVVLADDGRVGGVRAGGVRHGITILPERPWRDAAPLWAAAEEMGFSHAWTYDHLVWADLPDSPWFAAVPTLAAAAGVTSTIGLGTFVSSPNYRHPYTFTRDVLTLDDVSGGRFLCGLGAGGDLDAGILGEDHTLRERVDRFHEFVPLLDRLLREDRVDHVGAWYTARRARTLPGPVRDRATRSASGSRMWASSSHDSMMPWRRLDAVRRTGTSRSTPRRASRSSRSSSTPRWPVVRPSSASPTS
jgi:alkanesulfonate monooxygenase SsuD/methylene tetrahydromethanopterin reductase-like flavin-dependent oxidoreductase (luciferase family)